MSYDDIAALRYARAESRPDSFSLRLAPRLVRLFGADPVRSGQPLRLLDIGAGTGQVADVLRSAGFSTVSLDVSLPMLKLRTSAASNTPGAAVVGDATALPFRSKFDLITATFNVLNHLPDLDAASQMVGEVGRLLAPGGRFVFDINTRIGLEGTGRTTSHETGPGGSTTWTRHWIGPDRLRLRASGPFNDGSQWHYYDETIDKIVVPCADIEHWCLQAGLGTLRWLTDDLVTPIKDPEQHAVAFGVARVSNDHLA